MKKTVFMRVGNKDLQFCQIIIKGGEVCDIQGRPLTRTGEVFSLTPWPADECDVYNVCDGIDVLVPNLNMGVWI